MTKMYERTIFVAIVEKMKGTISIDFEKFDSWNQLDTSDKELAEKAFAASSKAYAPYSNFNVGAALKMSSGEIIVGSNQENIAFPSGLCAERVALFYAGANFPNDSINTICVVAEGDLMPKEQTLSPCGSCRQVMVESESRQSDSMRVILISQNGKVAIFKSAKDLLPLTFVR